MELQSPSILRQHKSSQLALHDECLDSHPREHLPMGQVTICAHRGLTEALPGKVDRVPSVVV